MPKDDQVTATKNDLKELREELKKDFKELKEKDLRDMEKRTKKDLQEMEERLMHHFNLVHDFRGVFKDRLEQHEDRIVRLEQHAGFARV